MPWGLVTMTTADQLAIVERRLGGEAKALALAEGGLVQGWMKTRRLLVVAQRPDHHNALLVFVAAAFPVASEDDLTLESAMPIDMDFK